MDRRDRIAAVAPAGRRYHDLVADARYRCTACGNLTRFDVTAVRRTRSFHHYTVGGELDVEDVEVLDETVESVECRWCGNADHVVVLDPRDVDTPEAGGTSRRAT